MNTVVSALVFLGLSFGAGSAFADHHGKGPMTEPTKEERAQMADMHSKMAECLRSEKSMKDCHEEMKANCPMMKDGKACPMGMDHHGHMHHSKGEKAKKK